MATYEVEKVSHLSIPARELCSDVDNAVSGNGTEHVAFTLRHSSSFERPALLTLPRRYLG